MCSTDCQESAALYGSDNARVHVYGFSTINSKNMILEGGSGTGAGAQGSFGRVDAVAVRAVNQGEVHDGIFKTAIVAAYLRRSG